MVDYATLPVPDDTPPQDYTWPERRSEIYNLIEEAGHPRNLERTQEQLGKRYDVEQQQISDDIQAIRDYEAGHVGDDVRANTSFVCEKAVRELMEDGEYEVAAKLQMQYFEWLQEAGEEDKPADKHELTGEDGGPLQIELTETVVETGYDE
jgi:hypothetical protein